MCRFVISFSFVFFGRFPRRQILVNPLGSHIAYPRRIIAEVIVSRFYFIYFAWLVHQPSEDLVSKQYVMCYFLLFIKQVTPVVTLW
jgi:hypothetical protein